MRTVAFALVMLLAGAIAHPQAAVSNFDEKDNRLIDEIITGIIESIIEQIQEAGLDPFELDRADGEYDAPVPGIFSAKAYVEDVLVTGLSNIVINDISFTGTTLSFDITLPQIQAVVGNAAADVWILSRNVQGQLSGRLAINDLHIAGTVNIQLARLGLEDLALDCRLGGIESELSVNIHGNDLSELINEYLGVTFPAQMNEYQEEFNRVVSNIVMIAIERLLAAGDE